MITKAKIHDIFSTLAQLNPEPKTELLYDSTFELLIAVLLSAQSTDIAVNKATRPLFAKANTPQAMIELGEEGVKSYIKSIGLYHNKAKNIIATCHILLDQHHSEVPNDLDLLQQLPGVGRKTALVVLNTAFGEHVIAVDTHIFRVARRLKISKSTTVLGVEKDLMKKIPKEFLYNAHHWLILHGRYICKAQNPQCTNCPIANICQSKDKKID
jgi:endonuclease III